MFGIDDLLILAGASGLAGGIEAVFGGKPSRREREEMEYWKERREQGAPPELISQLRSLYAPRIGYGLQERQNRLARGLRASGIGGTTEAFESLASIPSVEEALLSVTEPVNVQYRELGAQQYASLLGETEAKRREAVQSGLGTIMSSLGTVLGSKKETDWDSMMEALNLNSPIGYVSDSNTVWSTPKKLEDYSEEDLLDALLRIRYKGRPKWAYPELEEMR